MLTSVWVLFLHTYYIGKIDLVTISRSKHCGLTLSRSCSVANVRLRQGSGFFFRTHEALSLPHLQPLLWVHQPNSVTVRQSAHNGLAWKILFRFQIKRCLKYAQFTTSAYSIISVRSIFSDLTDVQKQYPPASLIAFITWIQTV